MTLAAGRLDKRVILQRPVLTKNAVGEEEVTWETVATVWAAIEPLAGRELWHARQVSEDVTHRVVTRWRDDLGVGANWRASHGGLVYHLIEPPGDPTERGELAEFLCRQEA